MKFKFNKTVIIHWAQKYEDNYPSKDRSTEERLKKLLIRQSYLAQKDLYDILNWKSPRIRHYANQNAPARIERITRHSFETTDEESRIESLLGQKGGLRGVGYPVASAILHFAFPDKYPIMDFRVIRSLGMEQPLAYKFDFWRRYCERLRRLSKKYGLSLRVVEKALWKFDKEQYSRFNKCD
jgi:hypothetical protein